MNALELFEKRGEELIPRIKGGFFGLFVGRSGSGKSAAEVSFPDPIYVFDIDNRIMGGLVAADWLGGEKKLKQIDFHNYTPLPSSGFEAMDNKLGEFKKGAPLNCPKSIFFDSIGTLIQMLALDSQRLRGVVKAESGKIRGNVKFLHPDDYQYVYTVFRSLIFQFCIPMAKMGINIVFSGWIVDKWGRPTGGNEFADQVIVGEQLIGPHKLCEEIPGFFDEIYYFRKRPPVGPHMPASYTVEFKGEFARSVWPQLPVGQIDITNKSFYDYWKGQIQK